MDENAGLLRSVTFLLLGILVLFSRSSGNDQRGHSPEVDSVRHLPIGELNAVLPPVPKCPRAEAKPTSRIGGASPIACCDYSKLDLIAARIATFDSVVGKNPNHASNLREMRYEETRIYAH
jgi:hypothetical protein